MVSKSPKITHHVASGAARLRHVFVRDLEIEALLGIYENERVSPQRIIVNIDLSVKEGADPISDDIKNARSVGVEIERGR